MLSVEETDKTSVRAWIDQAVGRTTRGFDGRSLPLFSVEDPATETVIAAVGDAGVPDALDALRRADEAFPGWAATPARVRAELLRRLYEAVMDHRESFAALITAEMGKTLREARAEVDYGADFLRWFSEEAARLTGQYGDAPNGGGRIITRYRPVGPAYLVTPWNFPLAMLTRKIGPALAAGCTVVVKPASATPLTAIMFDALARDVGVPDGVINTVVTTASGAVSRALLADPRLRKISFTGSTEVGRTLAAAATANMVRASMELGGNAPFVVMHDADLDAAVDGAVIAKLRNGGQSCVGANRFYVHSSVAERFEASLVERFSAITVGDGRQDASDVGPMLTASARSEALARIRAAAEEGLRVSSDGAVQAGRGHFVRPTVIGGVPADHPLVHEELFAPIAPIVEFDDEDELVPLLNDTEYGLAAYVYSRDVHRAIAFGERIESGIVGVNRGVVSDAAAPFGGLKASGLGREGGPTGIHEYAELQYFGTPR